MPLLVGRQYTRAACARRHYVHDWYAGVVKGPSCQCNPKTNISSGAYHASQNSRLIN